MLMQPDTSKTYIFTQENSFFPKQSDFQMLREGQLILCASVNMVTLSVTTSLKLKSTQNKKK